jgi:hypothetical protein
MERNHQLPLSVVNRVVIMHEIRYIEKAILAKSGLYAQ